MSAASAKPQEPSMEEILASIRRIISDDGGEDGRDEAGRDPRPQVGTSAIPRAVHGFAGDMGESATMRDGGDRTVGQPGFAAQPEALDAGRQHQDPHPDPVEDGYSRQDYEPAEPQGPVAAGPIDNLVSRATGESVGHAFNLLSHTVLSQNARTLEDMVQEMLRPMLKTWLDDNLPPLVERLVRHEIERVARGGR